MRTRSSEVTFATLAPFGNRQCPTAPRVTRSRTKTRSDTVVAQDAAQTLRWRFLETSQDRRQTVPPAAYLLSRGCTRVRRVACLAAYGRYLMLGSPRRL